MHRPRILCVAEDFPWPARDGYRIRLSHVVRALAETREVDFFTAARTPDEISAVPANVDLARCEVVPAPQLQPLTARLLARTLAGSLPKRLEWHDWVTVRRRLDAWARPPYDLVWYGHPDTMAGLGPVDARRVVLDADNLEDMRERSLRSAHARDLRSLIEQPRLTRAFMQDVRAQVKGIASSTLDARRWRRLQARLAREADAVAVCSELDRRRLGASNAVVIPNGYDDPGVGEQASPSGNVMVMIGRWPYPPNSDGARFFVHEILPLIRARVPDATIRLVGRGEGHLDSLRGIPGVVIVGEVPDVAGELARARVAVVPLRAGSGTRLKVLEAFAFRVPVVSTSIGCEGIDAAPETHLLVADRPEDFADACIRLLSDGGLRRLVAGEARSLFESRYRWDDIRESVSELVASVIGSRDATPAEIA
jgi:glycosyltransferase involved in cell wall biosynthesis